MSAFSPAAAAASQPAPDKASRAVRAARVHRVPLLAILVACVVAAVADVAGSFALGWALPPTRDLLAMRTIGRDLVSFRSFAGAECFLGDLGMTPLDMAEAATRRGVRWGLAMGLGLSLGAALGLLRVRLGPAR
jgi:hypothetical protein